MMVGNMSCRLLPPRTTTICERGIMMFFTWISDTWMAPSIISSMSLSMMPLLLDRCSNWMISARSAGVIPKCFLKKPDKLNRRGVVMLVSDITVQ